MRISDWSSDVCSSDLYQDRLDGSANYIFTNNYGGTTSAMVNRGGSDRRYFCGTLTAPDQVNVDPASYSTHKTELAIGRSEERRVGQECVSPFRSRWSP